MKKITGSFAAAAVYLVLMCFLLGDDMLQLFDAGLFGMLLLGGILLCLPHLENRESLGRMRGIFAKNALMTGYIETFMLLFVSLQGGESAGEDLLSRMALDFRPLFYGFICYLLLGRACEQTEEDSGAVEESGEEAGEEAEAQEQAAGEEQDLSILSRRERQVAQLVKRGLSNREIGEELFISEATVKKHVSHIFEKLEIKSRKDLK